MSTFPYLQGVYNITPTPFLPTGELDEASLVTLTEFNIAKGVDGMTILGVMGETSKLLDVERDRIIARVIEVAAGRIPICVGATHGGTDGCVAYCRRAQELGARALMVAPPKLARSNDQALRRHYLRVAEAVDIPVVVQDHPASAGIHMGVDFLATIGREAAHCNFIKLEDEPSPAKISQVLANNPTAQIFGGLGGVMLFDELRHGAIGVMTGFSYPEALVAICRAFFAGNVEGSSSSAAAIFDRYSPLIHFESQPGISLTLRKWLYAQRGAIAYPHPREPYPRVDESVLSDLRHLLARLSLVL